MITFLIILYLVAGFVICWYITQHKAGMKLTKNSDTADYFMTIIVIIFTSYIWPILLLLILLVHVLKYFVVKYDTSS